MVNLEQIAIEKVKALTPEQLQNLLLLLESWPNQTLQTGEAIADPTRAEAIVNQWLSDNLPDRFAAGEAWLIESCHVWYVPIELTYPSLGSLGQVGEALISAFSGTLLSVSEVASIKQAGAELYKTRQDDLQAAVS
ncbi:MAG: hypothetical protein AAF921_14010 [Cyanobacteria bacterium P01_D01_bin.44]